MIQHRKPTGTGDGLPVMGLRLEKNLRDWVKKKAEQKKTSESQIVRELIQKAMEEDTADKPKAEKESKKTKKQ